MSYFNYHAAILRLLQQQKLIGYYYTDHYPRIGQALVLLFDDGTHPVMPVRPHRFDFYQPLLPPDKQIKPPVDPVD